VVNVEAAQVDGMQVVPTAYVAHAPAPSQTPVVPQVEAAMFMQTPAGSLPPAGTGLHVPCWPARAQVAQLPQPASLQQNPSVQLALKHSAPAAQAAPLAFRLVQTFDMQL
jgi:hypothetical protein